MVTTLPLIGCRVVNYLEESRNTTKWNAKKIHHNQTSNDFIYLKRSNPRSAQLIVTWRISSSGQRKMRKTLAMQRYKQLRNGFELVQVYVSTLLSRRPTKHAIK